MVDACRLSRFQPFLFEHLRLIFWLFLLLSYILGVYGSVFDYCMRVRPTALHTWHGLEFALDIILIDFIPFSNWAWMKPSITDRPPQ